MKPYAVGDLIAWLQRYDMNLPVAVGAMDDQGDGTPARFTLDIVDGYAPERGTYLILVGYEGNVPSNEEMDA